MLGWISSIAYQPSLSLSKTDLRKAVARKARYGREASNWTTDQLADIDLCIEIGLRQFYYPQNIPDIPPHVWSFMTPVTTLATTANTSEYTLPAGFASLQGTPLTYTDTNGYSPILIRGEAMIRARQSTTDATGRPSICAVYPSYTSGTATGWKILFWPTPDAAYTIKYRYMVAADALRDSQYPLGGVQHAETIRASCLAAVESELNDIRGESYQRFVELLRGSILRDQLVSQTQTLGYNGDCSDGPSGGDPYERQWMSTAVTVYGVSY